MEIGDAYAPMGSTLVRWGKQIKSANKQFDLLLKRISVTIWEELGRRRGVILSLISMFVSSLKLQINISFPVPLYHDMFPIFCNLSSLHIIQYMSVCT